MRRLTSFSCEGAELGASLDGPDGDTGLLMVTGGGQTRIGSHRMFERLAHGLASRGHASFRYDRRGVGDSEGEDPGFRNSLPDMRAALAAFRSACPSLGRVYGIGLCDGATALALHGAGAGLDGLILLNPWFVEAEANEPPPAAIRHHYAARLTSLDGWRKLLTGSVSYSKLSKGLRKAASSGETALETEVAKTLDAAPLPLAFILAREDATAIAAAAALERPLFASARARAHVERVETGSHAFARDGDQERLLEAVLRSIEALGRSG